MNSTTDWPRWMPSRCAAAAARWCLNRAPACNVDGESLLAFCSNDYLGLSQAPALREAVRTAVDALRRGRRCVAHGQRPQRGQCRAGARTGRGRGPAARAVFLRGLRHQREHRAGAGGRGRCDVLRRAEPRLPDRWRAPVPSRRAPLPPCRPAAAGRAAGGQPGAPQAGDQRRGVQHGRRRRRHASLAGPVRAARRAAAAGRRPRLWRARARKAVARWPPSA